MKRECDPQSECPTEIRSTGSDSIPVQHRPTDASPKKADYALASSTMLAASVASTLAGLRILYRQTLTVPVLVRYKKSNLRQPMMSTPKRYTVPNPVRLVL